MGTQNLLLFIGITGVSCLPVSPPGMGLLSAGPANKCQTNKRAKYKKYQ